MYFKNVEFTVGHSKIAVKVACTSSTTKEELQRKALNIFLSETRNKFREVFAN